MTRLTAFAFSVWFLLPTMTCAQETLSAQHIVEKALVALGGREKLVAIHTKTAVGSVEVLGGFPGKYESWAKAPNQLKTVWDIGYIRQERGFDGHNGWERNASIRELVGRDLARAQREAKFDDLLTCVNTPAKLLGISAIPGNELPFAPQIQLSGAHVSEGVTAQAQGKRTYAVEFSAGAGSDPITFYFDIGTFLPLREMYTMPYEDGPVHVTSSYGDYRPVGGVMLPFAITHAVPDLPLNIMITDYKLNVPIDDSTFENPNGRFANEPYEVTLDTIPRHVYKENDGDWITGWSRFWGIAFPPSDSWLFNVVLNEKYGRHLDPISATMDFYSGPIHVKTLSYSGDALVQLEKFPVTRFSPQPEIYDFRHWGSEPTVPGVDRIVYNLQVRIPSGQLLAVRREIPLSYYHPKKKLIFPIKGNFIVLDGHEFYELGHKYEWSQHYGYDIVGLGPDWELTKVADAHQSEDYLTYATREILSPADGTVVYARNNDVPDDMLAKDYLRKMPDPISAIGGNLVIIDHGDGEYSLFAHMHKGSVRVKPGDKVKQGQVIGLMGSAGSAGSPHLHYQLQASPGLFNGDGLPSEFENIEWTAWLGKDSQIRTPKRGVYMVAR
jgi:murein DD-endopeptidase MepM/ murein hydrolase activator NlpD